MEDTWLDDLAKLHVRSRTVINDESEVVGVYNLNISNIMEFKRFFAPQN